MNAPAPSLGRRILMFPLARVCVALGFVLVPMVAAEALARALPLSSGNRLIVLALVSVPGVWAALRLYVALIERRGLRELAPAGALPELGAGLLLGAALFATVAGVLAAIGIFKVSGGSSIRVLPSLVAMAAVSGFTEEVLIRGIVFRIAEEALGSWPALLLSAALFGLGHIGNPGADAWSAAAIAIEAGILLGAAYMLTRRLWLPIGLHAAWNFTEGGVFGAATSGNEIPGLLKSTTRGPEWLSGGAFGAEASVVAVGLCLAAGVAMIALAAQRGRIVPPPWRRGGAAAAAPDTPYLPL